MLKEKLKKKNLQRNKPNKNVKKNVLLMKFLQQKKKKNKKMQKEKLKKKNLQRNKLRKNF